MSKRKVKEAAPVVESAAPAAEAAPALSINDLQLLAQVVDLASKRGAFQANELEAVGGVYTRLAKFLTHIAASQEAAPKEETAN